MLSTSPWGEREGLILHRDMNHRKMKVKSATHCGCPISDMETRSPRLVNMTLHTKCSKQLSVASSHGCEQFGSSAELRVVGWASRRETVWAWSSLPTSSVCPASGWDCVARAGSALQAENNLVRASLLFYSCLGQVRQGPVALTDPGRTFSLCTEAGRGPAKKYCAALKLKMVSKHNHKRAVPSFTLMTGFCMLYFAAFSLF